MPRLVEGLPRPCPNSLEAQPGAPTPYTYAPGNGPSCLHACLGIRTNQAGAKPELRRRKRTLSKRFSGATGHSGTFAVSAPLRPVSHRFYYPNGRPTDPTSDSDEWQNASHFKVPGPWESQAPRAMLNRFWLGHLLLVVRPAIFTIEIVIPMKLN